MNLNSFMPIITSFISRKKNDITNVNTAASADDALRQQAFDNSLQPNILSTVSTGRVVLANAAACQLLPFGLEAGGGSGH